ncbi:hypothetical protein EV426DRAFT_19473 [Tirmania nivea]|nr:hypothetical protein EV426DRAFT_19473 [Tirmania nivea]
MNSSPLRGPVEVDVNTMTDIAQLYSQSSPSGHAEEKEYTPTLNTEKRRASPKKSKGPQLDLLEGDYLYSCPLLGENCPNKFENCAQVKIHIFWHFKAFQCEKCGRCFGKSDGLKRHARSTVKCAKGRSNVKSMLSPRIKQRVKELQDATGYDAIMHAIKGWELDFKLLDTRATSSTSQGRRTVSKSSRRQLTQNASRTLNVNTNVGVPLPTPYTVQSGHSISYYLSTNTPDHQMHYARDMNAWQNAAVPVINSLKRGNATYVTDMSHRQSSQIVHDQVYPPKDFKNFGRNVAANTIEHALQTITSIGTPKTAQTSQEINNTISRPKSANQSSWSNGNQEAGFEGYYSTFISPNDIQLAPPFSTNTDLWHGGARDILLFSPVPPDSPLSPTVEEYTSRVPVKTSSAALMQPTNDWDFSTDLIHELNPGHQHWLYQLHDDNSLPFH